MNEEVAIKIGMDKGFEVKRGSALYYSILVLLSLSFIIVCSVFVWHKCMRVKQDNASLRGDCEYIDLQSKGESQFSFVDADIRFPVNRIISIA